MADNIFQLMEQKLSAFSKGKQQITAYILENPNEAAFQTAAQIGKAVKISESTVVRLAGDLGYKGFPEFQKALQQEVKAQLQRREPLYSPCREDEDRDPFRSGLGKSWKQLRAMTGGTVGEQGMTFARELQSCNSLHLVASSIGELLLPYCKYMSEILFASVGVLSTASPQVMCRDLCQVKEGDGVLALCLGEVPPSLCFVLEQGKEQGAMLFIMTDRESQYLTALSDHLWLIPRQDNKELYDISILTALLHGVFAVMASEREDAFRNRNKRIEEMKNAYENYELPLL